jgi:hypothetical protein
MLTRLFQHKSIGMNKYGELIKTFESIVVDEFQLPELLTFDIVCLSPPKSMDVWWVFSSPPITIIPPKVSFMS